MRWGRSLRVRLVLVAVFVTALPLAVAGWWLTHSAERSGRQLLEMRVREAIDETARDISQRWMEQRSALLDVAAEPGVRQALLSDARRSLTSLSTTVAAGGRVTP